MLFVVGKPTTTFYFGTTPIVFINAGRIFT
jgi:hypothetical protein